MKTIESYYQTTDLFGEPKMTWPDLNMVDHAERFECEPANDDVWWFGEGKGLREIPMEDARFYYMVGSLNVKAWRITIPDDCPVRHLAFNEYWKEVADRRGEKHEEEEQVIIPQPKRAAWRKAENYEEPLCNLQDHMQTRRYSGHFYTASFRRTKEGIPLSEIKCDDNVELFALKACEIARGILVLKVKTDWCILTSPKRRHKKHNFASKVCARMSELLGVPFYEDTIEATNRQRVNAVFRLVAPVRESNVIFYDDIITTGSTLKASLSLLPEKNVVCIIGIANRPVSAGDDPTI